jgi:hypothetical protein
VLTSKNRHSWEAGAQSAPKERLWRRQNSAQTARAGDGVRWRSHDWPWLLPPPPRSARSPSPANAGEDNAQILVRLYGLSHIIAKGIHRLDDERVLTAQLRRCGAAMFSGRGGNTKIICIYRRFWQNEPNPLELPGFFGLSDDFLLWRATATRCPPASDQRQPS